MYFVGCELRYLIYSTIKIFAFIFSQLPFLFVDSMRLKKAFPASIKRDITSLCSMGIQPMRVVLK